MAQILLVEDNINNAEYAIRILKTADHEVHHCIRGLDGARAARTMKPELVLLDFNLPDIDGSILVLTLKKQIPGVPIIAVTARAGSRDKEMARRYGFDAFIGKPYEPDELLETVESMLTTLKPE